MNRMKATPELLQERCRHHGEAKNAESMDTQRIEDAFSEE